MKTTRRDEKITGIRSRVSFLLFQQLYEFLSKKPSVAAILWKFHDVLDVRKSFGSRRKAKHAAESLDRVLRDNGETDDEPLEQEWPDEDETQITSTAHDIAREKRWGTFILVDFFSEVKCRLGHKTRSFSIGRDHYIACDECRAYIFLASNLMGCSWETTDIWLANRESVKGYKFIE